MDQKGTIPIPELGCSVTQSAAALEALQKQQQWSTCASIAFGQTQVQKDDTAAGRRRAWYVAYYNRWSLEALHPPVVVSVDGTSWQCSSPLHRADGCAHVAGVQTLTAARAGVGPEAGVFEEAAEVEAGEEDEDEGEAGEEEDEEEEDEEEEEVEPCLPFKPTDRLKKLWLELTRAECRYLADESNVIHIRQPLPEVSTRHFHALF